MPLFEPQHPESDEIVGSDAATRALSVTAVENDFVAHVYEKLASTYDFTFGPTLHPGRVQALQRMGIKSGDRILEVGVGTGINATLYPRDCAVTGIDLSDSMLEKARERVERKGFTNVRLLEMDAADLKFTDGSFDIVYAPYLISVVPDPDRMLAEARRVARPGGVITIINHFRSQKRAVARLQRTIDPITRRLGWTTLRLPDVLDRRALHVEREWKTSPRSLFTIVVARNAKGVAPDVSAPALTL